MGESGIRMVARFHFPPERATAVIDAIESCSYETGISHLNLWFLVTNSFETFQVGTCSEIEIKPRLLEMADNYRKTKTR